jgi:hypothetical protein
MIFKFDLITGPGQNHMMPQAGVHTAIQNTQPGTHPAKEVLLSSLPFLQSLKFVASLDLNLKCSSKFSLVKC